jgi:hypothetical protein
VPSSTSSSRSTSYEELAPPRQPWAKILVVMLLLCATASAGAELFARRRGFKPTLLDDADLWCNVRACVRPNDGNQVLLIGASRLQMDVDPIVIGRELSVDPPLQLAVHGSTSIPALEELAADQHFRGIVLCDVIPAHYFHTSEFDGGQQEVYVEHWKSRPFISSFERGLVTQFQSNFVLRLLASARSDNGKHWIVARQLPVPDYVRMLSDRCIIADFDLANKSYVEGIVERGLKRSTASPISEFQLRKNLIRIEECVSRIEARGGRVVFLRLPVSGKMRELEERNFPKSKFWDAFRQSSSAQFVDFDDYPSLRCFRCGDGSHLDRRDRQPFSRALAQALRPMLKVTAQANSQTHLQPRSIGTRNSGDSSEREHATIVGSSEPRRS